MFRRRDPQPAPLPPVTLAEIRAASAEELGRAKAFCDRLARRAIALEGTCTGEHGVGQGKMAFLEEELAGSVDLMREIKRAVDPDNILNPGKIFHLC